MGSYTEQHARSSGERPAIEAWPNQFPGCETEIEICNPEFTCRCPKTGQPDFASIRILYVPDQSCVELKSFKIYLQAYREMGIFHENVVNQVFEDLEAALSPRRLQVIGEFHARGGITTTVRRSSRAS